MLVMNAYAGNSHRDESHRDELIASGDTYVASSARAMEAKLLIYGATGYTGALITRAVMAAGASLALAGRNGQKLRLLASELGVNDVRVATLDDARGLDRALVGVRAVLNAAGPFRSTAPPIIEACLRQGVHYLDVTGEAGVIDEASRTDSEAKRRGIMVMPAVGFDVVPSDCLALHVARRARAPERLFVGLSGLDLMTRGSAKTIALQVGDPVWVRRAGVLDRVPPGSVERTFDYGAGPRTSIAVTWGDVVSAYFSTGIPNVTVYSEATPAVRMHHMLLQSFGWAIPLTPWRQVLEAGSEWVPEGPSNSERKRRSTIIVAETEDSAGRVVRSRIRTPDAYSMTALTASAVASRVLAGDLKPGFQTPARVYGADFPLSLPGVVREDL
jgi:short subunit dehydrogenase-like uncharacterized protein